MKSISTTIWNRPGPTLLAVAIIAGLWLVGAPTYLAGQSSDNGVNSTPFVIGHSASITSDILGEDRPLLIHTPTGYEQSNVSYPVLYLLDGDGHFHHTTGVIQFLAANNRMPDMIVVAIPNTGNRTHDLTPPQTEPDSTRQFPTAGGASKFLQFLTDELQPWVESQYRTAPYNVLIGHSFGGLFITEVLMEDAKAFNAYISISPSLWWDHEQYVEGATSIFEKNPELKGALYMTMASEGGEMLSGGWKMAGILEKHAPDSFRWKWTHMPEEDHGSIPHRSTYDGLEWLFDGWSMPNLFEVALAEDGEGLSRINKHHDELSERFGFPIQTPEALVNQVGYALLGMGRLEHALSAFKQNVENFPNSANVYDSQGDALDAACRLKEARASYARALELGEPSNDSQLDLYKSNVARLTEKISSAEVCVVAGSEM